MKVIISSIVGLVFGLAIGWYIGHARQTSRTDQDAKQLFAAMEWDDSRAAHIAVKAIPLIESGDTQKAIHLLALPIGSWYRVYANKAGTNNERLTLRAKIEALASSNSIVADALTNAP